MHEEGKFNLNGTGMRVRLRGFLLFAMVIACSLAANAQTDSLVAPKEQPRFKKFIIPAVKDPEVLLRHQEAGIKKDTAFVIYEINPIVVAKKENKVSFLKQTATPISFITTGALLSATAFEVSMNKNIRSAVGSGFHTKIDDYTRYVPIVQMYAADALGVKAKNHWFDQTKNLAISLIITDFITNALKDNITKMRPNQSMGSQSFPSAHTSQAFTTAAVLYEEFKDSSPLLAYSGFAVASATGMMRMMNNAHWFSDVMVGAGIGILVTKMVYMLGPVIKWNPFLKKNKELTMLPQISGEQYGMYVGYRF